MDSLFSYYPLNYHLELGSSGSEDPMRGLPPFLWAWLGNERQRNCYAENTTLVQDLYATLDGGNHRFQTFAGIDVNPIMVSYELA